MKSHGRWGRILRVGVTAISVLVLAVVGLVSIQQSILLWRAERLLDDIRAISMGKSTWADAQHLMHRWGAWGKWYGSCTAEACEYQIVLQDAAQALPSYFWTESHQETRSPGHQYKLWQLRLYSILGGRVAEVYAVVRVKNGIIWTKSYTVYTPRHFFEFDDFLIGGAHGETRFINPDYRSTLKLHPEYSIEGAGPCEGCEDGACTVCEMIQVAFTPYANPGIVNEFFDFNIWCITSWRQCNDPKQIMPKAWRLYRQDREALAKQSPQPGNREWTKCDSPLETLGRDYRYVLLTEVASIKTSPDSGFTKYVASLRGAKSLKNRAAFGTGLLKDPLVGWSDVVLPGGVRMADLRPGSRIILIFEWPLDDPGLVTFGEEYCRYVPDTDQNRAAILRGIARDALSENN